MFLGAHLLLGLGVAAVLAPAPALRRALARRRCPARSPPRPSSWARAASTVDVALAPLDLVRITRESLGLPPLSGVAPRRLGRCSGSRASLGLRVLGVGGGLARALRDGPCGRLARWP